MKWQEREAEIVAAMGIFALCGFGWCMYLLLVWADKLQVGR